MPIATISTENLIDQLWLPLIKKAKTIIYPRRRKNARMKLLTLTDGIEPKEIFILEQNNLIERDNAVAWVNGMQKRARIESESIECIDGSVYDQSFVGDSCPLNIHFPFDIMQDPVNESGRIEGEIQKIEKIISLQQNRGCRKFVLIYTTLIDTYPLDISIIIQNSDSVTVESWNGFNLNQNENMANNCEDKGTILRDVIEQLAEKYGYSIQGPIKHIPEQFLNDSKQSFSIGIIMVK